jgi:TRAP-type transport system periplasmic protein
VVNEEERNMVARLRITQSVTGLFLGIMLGLAFGCIHPEAEAASSGQKITLRYGHVTPADHFFHRAAERIATSVAKKTNGQVEIKIFPSSQLGTAREMVEGLKTGTVDMAEVSAGEMEILEPMMSIGELPYLIRDYNHAHALEDGPVFKEASRRLKEKAGVQILGYLESGFRMVYTRQKAIKSLEDFKGVKIRVPEVPVYLKTFQLLGANPTVVPFAEVYNAMQTRVVDGYELPPSSVKLLKLYEVSKYITPTRHFFLPTPVAVSAKAWTSLTTEQQKALQEAFDENLPAHRADGPQQADDADLKWLSEQGGMEMLQIDVEPLKKAVQPVYQDFARKIGGMEWIQRAIDTK